MESGSGRGLRPAAISFLTHSKRTCRQHIRAWEAGGYVASGVECSITSLCDAHDDM